MKFFRLVQIIFFISSLMYKTFIVFLISKILFLGSWSNWYGWTSCAPKNGDLCNKVQTRKRVIFFVCDYCDTEIEEKKCDECQHQCATGACSCNTGFKLNQG